MLRLALIQMRVGPDKLVNLKRATDLVSRAVSEHSAHLVCLPECFNSPYGTKHFDTYAEPITSDGTTFKAMSEVSKKHGIWLVAGSIPELGPDGRLYNCSMTFNPNGCLIGAYRKLHLFDIDIPGQFSFKESNSLSAGKELFCFELPVNTKRSEDGHDKNNSPTSHQVLRVGIGICYDVRFPEMSLVYANQLGCQLLLFPGAFNTKTGPVHWELLSKARALDTQCYVGMCSPACDLDAEYISHAESVITSPWGIVVAKAGKEEEIISANIDLNELKRVREAIPIGRQRRRDVYSLPKYLTKQSRSRPPEADLTGQSGQS
ncbi:Carbon-nitrogen hydrolase [Paragonimus heterotremus]|uniref:omega-amidase n=1 Tax=Paragonimus heterotremus TaxID=100268 RepID=A0A8J4T5E3_9TREM|nr:Carbon-nitrogen hydrolase [Paragonimus heterotremus]